MERPANLQARQRWQAFMNAAAAHLEGASHESTGEAAQCAARLVQTPSSWRRWETEFGIALRPVAACQNRRMQVRNLRRAAFSWVHRAAAFRHVRDRQLRGEQRRRLVMALNGHSSFMQAMVAEHDVYVRSVCHGSCATYLGQDVLGDPLYEQSMRSYQGLYMEYFQSYCAAMFPDGSASSTALRELLPMLKRQLADMRNAILEYPLRADWLRREHALRDVTGDTQRLPIFRRD